MPTYPGQNCRIASFLSGTFILPYKTRLGGGNHWKISVPKSRIGCPSLLGNRVWMTVCFQGLEIVKEHFNLVANSLDITAMPNIDGSIAKLAVISLSLEDIMTITWTENLNPGKKMYLVIHIK